ncbi:cytochrome P450 [Planctomycetes bacterium K23_9]|uniref:Cytochrome P450 n=1 Tax=Stieleria marina TaxID=1930275 RepID=A0A517NNW4_9BACT|nr:Cytochrome P450 [Planctomycetes bacterium K23_9]
MDISFKQLTSAEFKADPYSFCRVLRQNAPLVSCKIPVIGKIHFATTYSAVDQLLRDRQRFVLEARNAGVSGFGNFLNWFPRSFRVLAQNMLQKDEPDHRRLRQFAELAFLRKNIDGMRDDVTRLADESIDAFADESRVNLMDNFSRVLPLSVICELLGLPQEDRDKFSQWASSFGNVSFPIGILKMVPSIWKLSRYFRGQFELQRNDPQEGLIGELVIAEQDGSKLSEDELLAMAFVLLMAGHETTTHLISLSVMTLLQREDLRQWWWDHPQSRLQAVDELVRYLSPVQMTKPRYVAADTELDGYSLRRGKKVMGLLASANCDPVKFADAETIDFERHPNQHVGFGGGIHFCLGAQLARIETEIGITRLLERFPNLRLACSPTDLRWRTGTGMRALSELPIELE